MNHSNQLNSLIQQIEATISAMRDAENDGLDTHYVLCLAGGHGTRGFPIPVCILDALKAIPAEQWPYRAAATKIILERHGPAEASDEQVEAVCRFIASGDNLDLAIVWNMSFVVHRDGTLSGNLGGILISYEDRGWRVRFDESQRDFKAAVRLAASAALLLPSANPMLPEPGE